MIASDAIHNLRATLDNLVYILAGCPKGKRARDIAFPIVRPGSKGGRKAFERVAKRKLVGITPAALEVIERVQPYHGLRRPRPSFKPWPPYPLTVLEELSNIDKHRTLHLAYFSPSGFAGYASATPVHHEIFGGVIKDGAMVARYVFDEPNVDVKQPRIQLTLAVVVPKRLPLPLLQYLVGVLGLIRTDIVLPLTPYLA